MGYSLSPGLQKRVEDLIASGRYDNEEQVLVDALDNLEAWEEDLGDWPAIKEALDGIEDGTNKPMTLEHAIADIKREHGLS